MTTTQNSITIGAEQFTAIDDIIRDQFDNVSDSITIEEVADRPDVIQFTNSVGGHGRSFMIHEEGDWMPVEGSAF